jgi:hypothetical protein
MIKSRRIRWVGHVIFIGEMQKCLENFGWKALRDEIT